MKRDIERVALILAILAASPVWSQIAGGGFESGGFGGWTADPTWVIAGDSRGYYSGWAGRYWAWSGGKGEPATGVLLSDAFVMDRDAVRILISGWSSIAGRGEPRRWNYVALELEDGTEIDRVYAPDATSFVPAFLDGSAHRGRKVRVRAVDDADQATYSMLCIDDVRTADLPPGHAAPVPEPPAFDPATSIRLEDEDCLVVVDRSAGSVTRIRDKRGGVDLILEPRLAGSYRFALPIPGEEGWRTIEANWIFGRDQKLSSSSIEGGRLTLRWDGPLKNYLGEAFGVSVTMSIALEDGGVLFDLRIDNPTDTPVGEVYFPVLGGIQGLGHRRGQSKATQMIRPAGIRAARTKGGASPEGESAGPELRGGYASTDIFRVFTNMSAFGDQGPEQFYAYPEGQPEPWVGLYSPRIGRSVFLGARDPSDRNLCIRLELVPASSGTTRDDGNWPRPEELRGLPVGVELSLVDVAVTPARRAYRAAPVFLKFLAGGADDMRRVHAAWKASGGGRDRR
ncbi:MAG: hypothetical protein JXP34_19340 [Planctomycetes bacterium]|nr:hypothetical protein [Planctomycetota bacterium]